MQPVQNIVVYFINEETISLDTHQAISKDTVDLSKSTSNLDTGGWKIHRMENVCPLIKEWKAT